MYLCVSAGFRNNQPLFTLQLVDNGPRNEDKSVLCQVGTQLLNVS